MVTRFYGVSAEDCQKVYLLTIGDVSYCVAMMEFDVAKVFHICEKF